MFVRIAIAVATRLIGQAVGRAAVAGQVVAVVAHLSGIDDAVAAILQLTRRAAAIASVQIAVIARLTSGEIELPIAARLIGDAISPASIAGVVIPVIADLANILFSVAAIL